MVWELIDFVSIGDDVTSEFVNQLIDSVLEDDVAKVSAKGDIIVANGMESGVRLQVGTENQVLKSDIANSNNIKMEWVDENVGTDFITWAAFITELNL